MYIFTQYICVHLNRIIDLKSANPRYNSNNAQLNISVILNPVLLRITVMIVVMATKAEDATQR